MTPDEIANQLIESIDKGSYDGLTVLMKLAYYAERGVDTGAVLQLAEKKLRERAKAKGICDADQEQGDWPMMDYAEIKNVTAGNWRSYCDELPESEWREVAMHFSPYIRLGYSDGPGGVYHGEPWNCRTCTMTGLEGLTFFAHFIDEGDLVPHFYQFKCPVTLAEFNALADIIIPGVGVCSQGYGSEFAGRSAPFRYDELATLSTARWRPGGGLRAMTPEEG